MEKTANYSSTQQTKNEMEQKKTIKSQALNTSKIPKEENIGCVLE